MLLVNSFWNFVPFFMDLRVINYRKGFHKVPQGFHEEIQHKGGYTGLFVKINGKKNYFYNDYLLITN